MLSEDGSGSFTLSEQTKLPDVASVIDSIFKAGEALLNEVYIGLSSSEP